MMAGGMMQPGMPQNSGGNNPAVAAAQRQLGAGRITAGTDPNQMPQGPQAQGQAPQGAPLQGGSPVDQVLAQALQLIAQNPTPQTAASVEAFLTAVEQLIRGATAPGGQAPAPVGPQGPPAMMPPR